MPATSQGKAAALIALDKRRKESFEREQKEGAFDNSKLPAGAPMFFPCISCGAMISVSETYIKRPKLCTECQAMKDMGWLLE